MTLGDIQDKGSVIFVTIPTSKTKTQRIFTITDGTTNNISIYHKYVALRPPTTPHNRLFVYYKSNKCTVQPVGINTFSKLPSLIAEYLQLPEVKLFTGHCFRRTSAKILVNHGNTLSLKGHGGWRSNSAAEGYVDTLSNKVTVANEILGEINASSLNKQNSNSTSSIDRTAANFNNEI
jgi:integrase